MQAREPTDRCRASGPGGARLGGSSSRRVSIKRVVLVVFGALALGLGPQVGWAHHSGDGHHWGGHSGHHPHHDRDHDHDHHHFHGVFFVGAPFFNPWPYYYYGFPPQYYYYPSYWLPSYQPPVVYVERFEGHPAPGMRNIYCPNRGAYYPRVRSCPGGWMRVLE